MPNALVLCVADPSGNPRPNRMIRCLARDFAVHLVSAARTQLQGVAQDTFSPPPSGLFARLKRNANLLLRRYDGILWPDSLRALVDKHRALDHALISVHELRLLPFALAIRRSGKILFDAREYYPRHYEDIWWWRLLHQPMNRMLCTKFMPQADVVVTVCQSLADEYHREYGIDCTLLPSYPSPVACTPGHVAPGNIRMIHHGLASRSRQIERMIEMMDHLPDRFSLDLMLMPSDERYMQLLRSMCLLRPRVRLLPPVPFAELVSATNAYDVGVFLVPPGNFNLRFTLPNKFFEYIQARLMIAIGPSPEMARLVKEHDLGVVAQDFSSASLAAALAPLTAEAVARFKQRSHHAAALFNSDVTDSLIRSLAMPGNPEPPTASLHSAR